MILENGVIFQNRCEDAFNTEAFAKELNKYIEDSDELYAVILEENRLKAMWRSTLWYGYEGVDVKEFLIRWRDKLDELKSHQKETVTGKYEGYTITISATYGGYKFTQAEIDALFAGKEITINYKTRNGDNRCVTGKLDKKDWPENSIQFWGFIPNKEENNADFFNVTVGGKAIKFKKKFGSYFLTEDDIADLISNNPIFCIITNSNGKRVAVKLKLTHVDNDYYKLDPDWKMPRVKFGKNDREFTALEIKRLYNGETIFMNDLVGKNGNTYSGNISWKDGQLIKE